MTLIKPTEIIDVWVYNVPTSHVAFLGDKTNGVFLRFTCVHLFNIGLNSPWSAGTLRGFELASIYIAWLLNNLSL